MPISTIPVEQARSLVKSAQTALAEVVQTILKIVFNVELSIEQVVKDFSTPKPEFGDIAIATFSSVKALKAQGDAYTTKFGEPLTPVTFAARLSTELTNAVTDAPPAGLSVNGKSAIKKISPTGGFINVMFSIGFHAQVVSSVVAGQFQDRIRNAGKDKVMIEYSQPNTHKAFHVGHMRNAALGDSLIRLYEQAGHEVVAVNYFGDEGAHVAKCLWYLQKIYMPKAKEAYAKGLQYDPTNPDSVYPMQSIDDIDVVPVEARAEWLGDLYTKAVDLLDLSLYTSLPFPMVIAATVLTKQPHPDPEAPANWNVCTLDIGAAEPVTVVCGGTDYEVGDSVAYLPVGAKLTKKMGTIEPRDMKGVSSCGVMLAEKELGLGPKEEESKKKKGSSASSAATANNKICKLPAGSKAGENLAEIGRLPEFKGASVMEEYNRLKKEAADVLIQLENQEPESVALWRKTGQYSLDEFASIYKWLDCRFDHNFTESEVSEPSRHLVKEWLDKGFLTYDNGAVVADLTQFNLGKCVLLKSDGAGLYATKDLSLAARKFDQFQIDKSIYVVDAAQTYHFQQVFKTLELAGYPQAKKCLHIPYGIVVLPSGRMSSRKGNVLLFSQLRNALSTALRNNYGELSDESVRQISVAAIKYGMLNHDASKDIVFEIEKWTQNTGNTGPYLLYAYSRIMSIFTMRDNYDGTKFDLASVFKKLDIDASKYTNDEVFDLSAFVLSNDGDKFVSLVDYDTYLTETVERNIMLHIHKFWNVLFNVVDTNNPSPLCDYVFQLAQLFSGWYEAVRLTSLPMEAVPTKLVFIYSIAQMIKKCMNLLGCGVVNKM